MIVEIGVAIIIIAIYDSYSEINSNYESGATC